MSLAWILLSMLICASCTKEKPVSLSENEIRFNLSSIQGPNTKVSMIDGANPSEALEKLKTLCSTSTNTESVGIWADYELKGETNYNILKNTKVSWDNNEWIFMDSNNQEVKRYWVTGGVYKFRVFFPHESGLEHVTEASSATSFIFSYNTQLYQEDLLLGYKEIDTSAPGVNLAEPLEVSLKHALAAIRFRVRFKDGFFDEDALTATWFENTTNTNPFFTIGTMIYGTGVSTEEQKENIYWIIDYAPQKGEFFYRWEPKTPVIFKNTALGPDDDIVATAFTGVNEANFHNADPVNGWLYMIPQELHPNIQFCFTTRNGGNIIQKFQLPLVDGVKDTDGKYKLKAGYRYTLNIVISETNLETYIDILPWNRYESSFNFDF